MQVALMLKSPIPYINHLFMPLSEITQHEEQHASSLPSLSGEAAYASNTVLAPHKAQALYPKACQTL